MHHKTVLGSRRNPCTRLFDWMVWANSRPPYDRVAAGSPVAAGSLWSGWCAVAITLTVPLKNQVAPSVCGFCEESEGSRGRGSATPLLLRTSPYKATCVCSSWLVRWERWSEPCNSC